MTAVSNCLQIETLFASNPLIDRGVDIRKNQHVFQLDSDSENIMILNGKGTHAYVFNGFSGITRREWRLPLQTVGNPKHFTATAVDSGILVTTGNSIIYLLDKDDGHIIESYRFNAGWARGINMSMTVAANKLFVCGGSRSRNAHILKRTEDSYCQEAVHCFLELFGRNLQETITVHSEKQNCIYVMGGACFRGPGPNQNHDQIWKCDLNTLEWEKSSCGLPERRISKVSACFLGNRDAHIAILIDQDIWLYSVATDAITKTKIRGPRFTSPAHMMRINNVNNYEIPIAGFARESIKIDMPFVIVKMCQTFFGGPCLVIFPTEKGWRGIDKMIYLEEKSVFENQSKSD